MVTQPKPQFCITIKPLDWQVLFGVHIVLLEEEDGRSEQHVVRVVEGGIEVVEGEAHFAGLTAELEYPYNLQILSVSEEVSHPHSIVEVQRAVTTRLHSCKMQVEWIGPNPTVEQR